MDADEKIIRFPGTEPVARVGLVPWRFEEGRYQEMEARVRRGLEEMKRYREPWRVMSKSGLTWARGADRRMRNIFRDEDLTRMDMMLVMVWLALNPERHAVDVTWKELEAEMQAVKAQLKAVPVERLGPGGHMDLSFTISSEPELLWICLEQMDWLEEYASPDGESLVGVGAILFPMTVAAIEALGRKMERWGAEGSEGKS